MFTFAFPPAFLSFAWFGAGFITSIIGINPFLTLLFFDLPTAISFFKRGYFLSKAPIISYLISLLIVSSITIYAWHAALTFSQTHYSQFLWGLGVAAIPGLAFLFKTQENLTDLIQDNQAYLSSAGEKALMENRSQTPLSTQPTPATPSDQSPFLVPVFLKLFKQFKIKLKLGKFQILIQ